MTIQTADLIETINALISDLCWCSCKSLSTYEHTVAIIMDNKYATVFSWKGESLEEYWDCILNALIKP